MTEAANTNSSEPKPPDLETRVADRKRELITEIVEHKKSSHPGAPEAIARLASRLAELAQIMKDGVVDGWANVGEGARRKLDDWIAR